MRAASVKDVAARAGVSLGTVSNVMNRPAAVSPLTRQRVNQAMAELGYVRNESARQLRAGRSLTVAYLMLDARNPFFTDVAAAIEEAVEEAEVSLVLCNSGNRPDREVTHLERLREQRVEGILVTPIDPDADMLRVVADSGVPVVLLDRVRTELDLCSVSVDSRRGGQLAVEHLLERGHRRVAFIGPTSIGQVRDRLDGAREAWGASGLAAEDLSVLDCSELTVAEGVAAGQRLAGLTAQNRPSAAFCANDLLALGLLQQTVQSGRQVPADLAIVGYDDIEFAAAAAVPLTSVRQPRHELGVRAAQLILDETKPEHRHQQVQLLPQLVARSST